MDSTSAVNEMAVAACLMDYNGGPSQLFYERHLPSDGGQAMANFCVGTWIHFTFVGFLLVHTSLAAKESERPEIHVRPTADFSLAGDGRDPQWSKADWVELQRRPGGELGYSARFKTLYSSTGIYFLFHGTDKRLTATLKKDFQDLWTEDVFEVFLWTDERHPIYFEYEISPLNRELPILVPNFGGQFLGWRPWHYEGDRKSRKAVAIAGGPQRSNASITAWSAEVFLPYALLNPLQNVPPQPGTRWRANVYRVDYDGEQPTQWDWSRVGPSFHEYQRFGTFVFK